MDRETIQRLYALQNRLHEINTQLTYMESWGETLFRKPQDDRFVISISNGDGKVVFQRKITRSDVESEFNASLLEYEKEKAQIEKEIENL